MFWQGTLWNDSSTLSHFSSAQSLSSAIASTLKSANPNPWNYGAGSHEGGTSLGEQQTLGGGGAGILEAAIATSTSATTSASNFASS